MFDRTGIVKPILKTGGEIRPLLVPSTLTNGTGLLNPSVYIDDDKILVNIRHVGYTLYHSEVGLYEHQYGPLQYLHPESDRKLRTFNYIAELDKELNIEKLVKINTERLDVEPKWEFVGLEDCRVVRWDKKLYVCGVRRDTTPNGQGRMELSELNEDYEEISRFRIPAPGPNSSYCEKNWMPIIDMPYHYVKWSNPTEIVKVDITEGTCKTVYLDESKFQPRSADLRGGSQVIPFKGYHIALSHEVKLYNSELGRKNGRYRHRFLVWDKDWNLIKVSPIFSFLTGQIEFAAGLAEYGENFLITFGFQDNAAYIVKAYKDFIWDFIWEKEDASESA